MAMATPFGAKATRLAPKAPLSRRWPKKSAEAEWIIGRRVTRKALMSRRAQSDREGADGDEASNS